MQIDFVNVDKFCEKLKPITTNKIYVRKDFHSEGIFSQVIFGPTKNYTCGCGMYFGRSKVGTICSTCKVEILNSNERRKRFAKIELPFPIINPIMYYLICKIGKNLVKDILHNLIFKEDTKGYYWDQESEKFIHLTQENEIPEGVEILSGLKGAYQVVEHLIKQNPENSDWIFVSNNLDKFFMSNVIVIPPAFRPISKSKDVQKRDQLNDLILTILNFVLLKNEEYVNTIRIDHIYDINSRYLHYYVFEYYKFILDKFSKKEGIIRSNILGKRNDFSGRAVIAPDPTLKLEYCRIPYFMLLELYKLELANALQEQRQIKAFHEAILFIDECIRKEDYSLYNLVERVCSGKYVILNRQPTLHRMGILSFKVLPCKDYVIYIHPMACEPYNADFDGDTMAIYRALYHETEHECEEKLLLTRNLLSPTTGSLIVGTNQDIVLGLFLATKEDKPTIKVAVIKTNDGYEIKQIDKNVDCNLKPESIVETTPGRFEFYQCLPFIYQKQIFIHSSEFQKYFNKPVNKTILTKILNDVAKAIPDEVAKTLDNIKNLGLLKTTLHGSTISLNRMKLPGADQIVEKVLDDHKLSIYQKIAKMNSPEIMDLVKANFEYSDFINSGSRGSWDQAKQIILCRSFVSDSKGKVVPEPIRNSFVNGLTRKEYFHSSYGTRKGLLDTAIFTGVSGYLTRKTIYSTANIELDYNTQDCGTIDTYKVYIHEGDLKLARSLLGRYHIFNGKLHEITLSDYFKLCENPGGFRVNLRSPIFCKNKNICLTCYGRNSEIVKSRYIGIIAAQALGEVGTQLVMRTFHTGGVAHEAIGDTDKQDDIVSDLGSAKSLLHYNLKLPYSELPLELYKIYVKHRNIQLVHFECIVSQMMWREDKKWRLLPDRDLIEPEIISVLQVPQRENWLLALAFHKPKDYILDGIIKGSRETEGILEKIMTNDHM